MRTMVLLGAGASKDAGLPLTNDFADLLLEEMSHDYKSTPELAALNFVYGAMVNARSERGENPRAAVNVETMISAIRLLAHRDEHEAAPFITSWKSPVSAFGYPAGARLGGPAQYRSGAGRVDVNTLKQAFNKAHDLRFADAQPLLNVMRSIAQEAAGRTDNGSLYVAIERALLERVRRILNAPRSVEYLAPLIGLAREQPGGLDIATLNYDRTVELAADAGGVPVAIGIDRWRHGQDMRFRAKDGVINLMKIHGSIDWKRVPVARRQSGRALPATQIVRTDEFTAGDVPAIVIGDREKLASGGPILALLHAFQHTLRRADRLVVVGYGFADEHVNSVIKDWLTKDQRTMTVLDPAWPALPQGLIWGEDPFAGDLRRQLTWNLGVVTPGGGDVVPPRLKVIRAGAADGLAQALTATPALEPVPRFEVVGEEVPDDPNVVLVAVTNLGSDLTKVSFTATLNGGVDDAAATELRVRDATATPDHWQKSAMHLPALMRGQQVDVELRFATGRNARHVVVRISGDDTLNRAVETWEAPMGEPDAPLARRDPGAIS